MCGGINEIWSEIDELSCISWKTAHTIGILLKGSDTWGVNPCDVIWGKARGNETRVDLATKQIVLQPHVREWRDSFQVTFVKTRPNILYVAIATEN